MSDFQKMLGAARGGEDPVMIVESAAGPMGQDRNDEVDSEGAKLAAFNNITGTIQSYNGYVGPDWITQTGDQLKTADAQGRQDLANWARANRDQYAGSARIDCDGCWNMWDNIYKGVQAFGTDQLPPPPPPMS